MQYITAPKLKEIVKGEFEFALLDVRERDPYSKAHILLSTCVPLGQLELSLSDLLPRLSTKIVLISDDPKSTNGLSEMACMRLQNLGYTDVSILEGGISAWQGAGFEMFSGNGSYSKAFGEWIAEQYDTPFITPEELQSKKSNDERQTILDSRPKGEYHRMTIPGSINAPGAELAYRVHDTARNASEMVVVNCAGRTRSIIGAQSLVNSGIPNPVAALRNGTMGWQLAGFELEYGQTRSAPPPSPEGLSKARECATGVAKRFGVRKISYETLKQWMSARGERTTYVFDVRLPEEFAAGHFEGSRNAQGGQLVQASDEYISVFNARLVLIDDTEVRAIMTASWMIQMGWPETYVLEGGIGNLPLTKALYKPSVLGFKKADSITTGELQELLENSGDQVAILDVAAGAYYKGQHIAGAWWGIRSRLLTDSSKLPTVRTLVLTSEDGILAHFAAKDLENIRSTAKILVLEGGTKAWIDSGNATAAGMERPISAEDDAWYMPYMHPDAPVELKMAYFEWEYGLVGQIERDGTAKFRKFPKN